MYSKLTGKPLLLFEEFSGERVPIKKEVRVAEADVQLSPARVAFYSGLEWHENQGSWGLCKLPRKLTKEQVKGDLSALRQGHRTKAKKNEGALPDLQV